MCDAGNQVVFNKKGGYVVNDVTGKRTYMTRERGLYNMSIWVKSGKGKQKENNDGDGLGFIGLDNRHL